MRFTHTALASVLLTSSIASACCMLPRQSQRYPHPGSISQRMQQAIITHADGREELILGIDYQIEGATPDQFAWIITTPSEPDAYRVADLDIFDDMNETAQRLLVRQWRYYPPGGRGRAAGHVESDLEFGTPVTVGPYDIQPVRALGLDALTGLNTWLDDNGFPTEDPDHMAYFVENDFTFLCIKVTPEAGSDQVAAGGQLPPLHLSFETERPYYPLRFSTRQGVFDVNLHILTEEPVDFDASQPTLGRLNWSNIGYLRNHVVKLDAMPASLRDAIDKGHLGDVEGELWHYSNVFGRNVNEEMAIASWPEDIFLTTG